MGLAPAFGQVISEGPQRIGDPYPLTTCPVSGEKLGEMGPPVVYLHEGREIRYDARLGVYAVVGFPDLYFLNNIYYRYDYDHWYWTHALGRSWCYCNDGDLPPGLAKKYKHGKKHKRGK